MTPKEVMQMVADKAGVTIEQMQGNSRKHEIVFTRFVTTLLLTKDKVNPRIIAGLFPNHHRTSVVNYPIKIKASLMAHKPFAALYEVCDNELSQLAGQAI